MGNDCLTIADYMKKYKIPNTPKNYDEASDEVAGDPHFCSKNFISMFALPNKRKNEKMMQIQGFLNISIIVIISIALHFFRYRQRKIVISCDQRDICANDYSILVKNIKTGLSINYRKALKEYFSNTEEKLVVKNVVLIYKMDKQYEVEGQKNEILERKKKFLSTFFKRKQKPAEDDPQLIAINKEIDNVENELEKLEQIYWKGEEEASSQFSGAAIISFNSEEEKDMLNEQFVNSKFERFMILIGYGHKIKGKKLFKFNDQYLIVKEAMDPSDIIYENFKYPLKSKLIRNFIGGLLSTILLFLGGYVMYVLSKLQFKESQKAFEDNKGDKVPLLVTILGLTISVMIYVTDIVIEVCLAAFTDFAKFESRTFYNISLSTKQAVAQFINNGLMTFIVNYYVIHNYYGRGGLIYTIFYVFLMNAAISIVTGALHPFYYLNHWLMRREENKGEFSLMTQGEAQKLFQNPSFNIAEEYGELLRTVYFTCFYASLVPLGVPITILSFLCMYWVYKYNITRRSNIDYNLDYHLSLEMIEMIEYSVVLFALGSFIDDYCLTKQVHPLSLLAAFLGILNALIPMEKVNKLILPLKEAPPHAERYDEADKYIFETVPSPLN